MSLSDRSKGFTGFCFHLCHRFGHPPQFFLFPPPPNLCQFMFNVLDLPVIDFVQNVEVQVHFPGEGVLVLLKAVPAQIFLAAYLRPHPNLTTPTEFLQVEYRRMVVEQICGKCNDSTLF